LDASKNWEVERDTPPSSGPTGPCRAYRKHKVKGGLDLTDVKSKGGGNQTHRGGSRGRAIVEKGDIEEERKGSPEEQYMQWEGGGAIIEEKKSRGLGTLGVSSRRQTLKKGFTPYALIKGWGTGNWSGMSKRTPLRGKTAKRDADKP